MHVPILGARSSTWHTRKNDATTSLLLIFTTCALFCEMNLFSHAVVETQLFVPMNNENSTKQHWYTVAATMDKEKKIDIYGMHFVFVFNEYKCTHFTHFFSLVAYSLSCNKMNKKNGNAGIDILLGTFSIRLCMCYIVTAMVGIYISTVLSLLCSPSAHSHMTSMRQMAIFSHSSFTLHRMSLTHFTDYITIYWCVSGLFVGC